MLDFESAVAVVWWVPLVAVLAVAGAGVWGLGSTKQQKKERRAVVWQEGASGAWRSARPWLLACDRPCSLPRGLRACSAWLAERHRHRYPLDCRKVPSPHPSPHSANLPLGKASQASMLHIHGCAGSPFVLAVQFDNQSVHFADNQILFQQPCVFLLSWSQRTTSSQPQQWSGARRGG
jgi:hypothetical protein